MFQYLYNASNLFISVNQFVNNSHPPSGHQG
jgi:hypothetical protein